MTSDDNRGLGLLLLLSSVGCLGLPRFTDDDGDGGGDGTTTMPASEDEESGPEPTTVAGTTTPGMPVDTGVETVTSVTTATTATTVTVSVGDSVGVTTDGPSEVCQSYSELITECYSAKLGEAAYGNCVEYLASIEQNYSECLLLFEEFMVCLNALSCREVMGGNFCEVERQKYDECMTGG
jgi:hypothetical protein